ncbi:CRISPR-associated protein Cas4 [Amycolatopsis cihanbeyliensis]|uniref:CRISPR-associated exonuclease Cas4 n=1 Tax=Amycolatopsis cihanbeyliensis TaxID=1128664 RepID=A0A542DET9_AMYCI|nr:CRISPR-associated protein Cas4 [Amycolatopsis cihanbeyliensis]TQJ01598.1 CRISPR-associated Cas4 family exonuclease [Amycolatopsis cihanbeyliensis]
MDPGSNPPADEVRSIPLSLLEHYAYCPRQAALIGLESYFESNTDTVRGDLAHATVDRAGSSHDRLGQRVWHSLPVWSNVLGLHGICDAVHLDTDAGHPIPVEHKSGSYRPGGPADLQVAAQVLCLREMFGVPIPAGIVFSGRDRHRHNVLVDETLRREVLATTHAIRTLLDQHTLPPPVHDARCRRCSLSPGCLPDAPSATRARLCTPREPGDW